MEQMKDLLSEQLTDAYRVAMEHDQHSLAMMLNHAVAIGRECEYEAIRAGIRDRETIRVTYPPWMRFLSGVIRDMAPAPAPAGVSAAPTTRDRPIGPAGAAIPTTSEPTCDTCHRLLSCVGTCPKGCLQ